MTLNAQLADETRAFEKDKFNQLLDELYGQENIQIHTYNPRHPIMQHVYISKSTLFDSLCTMIYKDHEISLIKPDSDETLLIVTK